MPADIEGLTVLHYQGGTSDKFYAILPFPINKAGLALYGKNSTGISPQTHVYSNGNARAMIGKKVAKGYKKLGDASAIFQKVEKWIKDNEGTLTRNVRLAGFGGGIKITDFLIQDKALDL
jgi:hypothetical protein